MTRPAESAGGSNVAELVPGRPRLALIQPSVPGGGVVITSSQLAPGAEYWNVFSTEPAAGGPGSGPYLGLHSSNVAGLFAQFYAPLGAIPFHFAASSVSFGPYPVPAGIVIEGVSFGFTGSQLGCVSTIARLTVQ